eukprot:Selendium_serpulae@DN4906_c0_g1_i1.p1
MSTALVVLTLLVVLVMWLLPKYFSSSREDAHKKKEEVTGTHTAAAAKTKAKSKPEKAGQVSPTGADLKKGDMPKASATQGVHHKLYLCGIKGVSGRRFCVGLSLTSKRLAVGSDDGTVRVYEVDPRNVHESLTVACTSFLKNRIEGDSLYVVDFSGDGKQLVGALADSRKLIILTTIPTSQSQRTASERSAWRGAT